MLNAVFRSMRPSFLILAPVCVFLGYSASYKYATASSQLNLILAFVAATLAHISVNTLNEYFDYKSGLDAITQRTPFSGGSGALVEQPAALNKVGLVALLSLAGTIILGLYWLILFGVKILPLGLLGVAIILTYTQWLNKRALLCLIAPGLAFGPLMVMGTALVVSGEFIRSAALVSLLPFFLVNNLLLANQLPDIEADKQVGRRHLAIVYGVDWGLRVYALFALSAAALLIAYVTTGVLTPLSLLALPPLALSALVYFGLHKHRAAVAKMLPFLGINVFVTLATPLVLALSLLLSA